MAIIIPSKNILEINNQKVVDNEVDNIEVSYKNIVQDNHYAETVHNEEITSGFVLDSSSITDTDTGYINKIVLPDNPFVDVYGSYVCANSFYYVSKEIFIPFKQDNTHVLTSILTGLNKEGNNNINYSCYGQIISGITHQSMTVTVMLNSLKTGVESIYGIYVPPTLESAYIKEKEDVGNYSIQYEQTSEYSDFDGRTTQAKLNIEDKSNLSTVLGEEVFIGEDKYLKLSLSNILCGMRIIRGQGRSTATPMGNLDDRFISANIGNSTYEQYIPEKVSITIYGNTLGIDLKDKVIKIGDGQHVYSFDGNELMQTSNVHSERMSAISVGSYVRDADESYSYYRFTQELSIGEELLKDGNVIYNANGESAYVEEIDIENVKTLVIRAQKDGEFANMSNVLATVPIYSVSETLYYKVLNDWKSGKEVAVIRCLVDDYYEEKETDVKITFQNKSGNDLQFTLDVDVPIGAIIKWGKLSPRAQVVVTKYENGIYYGTSNVIPMEYGVENDGSADKIIKISPQRLGYPMTIMIGDVVTPYVKSPEKTVGDKPMSKYYDKNTPKNFLVVGKGIIHDGQLLQEITLQEIQK